jgi:catechol 2,3-dioxygenase-like lactoylglutathione lyase family enzyme
MDTMNALVPELIVSDLKESLNFYCAILGFRVEYDRPEDKFAFLSYHASQLMLEQDDGEASPWRIGPLERPFGRGINFSIQCPDAQGLANVIVGAGLVLRKPLEERWYRDGERLHGELNFLLQDPDGYLLRFTQSLGFKPVEQP